MDYLKRVLDKKITEEAKKDNDLKNPYEKYFYSVISKYAKISKIKKKKKQKTPDFEIVLGNKKFITEVKGLDLVYTRGYYLIDMFRDVCANIDKKEIYESYMLDCSPILIHINDFDIVKKELTKKLSGVVNKPGQEKEFSFSINGKAIKEKAKEYKFTLKPKSDDVVLQDLARNIGVGKDAIKDIQKSEGNIGNVTSNLTNKLFYEDFEGQYKEIDFLTLINLNEQIKKDDIIEKIFKGEIIKFFNEDNGIKSINDDFFTRYKNIKLILVLNPLKDEAYIIPSICNHRYKYNHDEKNSKADIIYPLVTILKSNDFIVEILSLNKDWVKF